MPTKSSDLSSGALCILKHSRAIFSGPPQNLSCASAWVAMRINRRSALGYGHNFDHCSSETINLLIFKWLGGYFDIFLCFSVTLCLLWL